MHFSVLTRKWNRLKRLENILVKHGREEHRHYGTDATARHLATYICDELEKED